MFGLSLIVSVIAWLVVVIMVACSARPRAVQWACAATMVGGLICSLGSVVLPIQGALIAAIAVPFRKPGTGGTLRFAALSAALTTVPYIGVYVATVYQPAYNRLRARYPYESMADRVTPPAPAGPLTGDALTDLAAVADKVDYARTGPIKSWYSNTRRDKLEVLHDRTIELFVASAGFGVARLVGVVRPDEDTIDNDDRHKDEPLPRQPGSRIPFPYSSDLSPPPERFGRMHQAGVVDFVRPRGWGFVKDRDHVAGHLPHRFQAVPADPAPWQLARVELIGLVVHPQPVVYVGDTLPAMADARTAPTRPLDGFEAVGLEALQRGESLFARERPPHAKAVGAIRATSQCVACHGGREGDLLGAFAYSLVLNAGPTTSVPVK